MSKRHYTDYDKLGAPEEFDKTHFGGSVGHYFQSTQEELILNMIITKDSKILDVATGTGRIAIPLAKLGAEVIGVDASKEMLNRAEHKALNIDNAKFQLGDAHNLAFPDNEFDYVISFRALMHFDEWRRVLGQMCSVSKKFVIFDVPPTIGVASVERLFYKVGSLLGKETKPYKTFLISSIKKELENNGFKIISVHKQFVLPFKFHRMIGNLYFTKITEGFLRCLGLKRLFGAPVTIKAEKIANL